MLERRNEVGGLVGVGWMCQRSSHIAHVGSGQRRAASLTEMDFGKGRRAYESNGGEVVMLSEVQ